MRNRGGVHDNLLVGMATLFFIAVLCALVYYSALPLPSPPRLIHPLTPTDTPAATATATGAPLHVIYLTPTPAGALGS